MSTIIRPFKIQVTSIANTDNKVSADEEEACLGGVMQATNKPTKTYQAELESGYQQTARMGGRVLLSFFLRGNERRMHFPIENAIDCKVLHRNITRDDVDFIK